MRRTPAWALLPAVAAPVLVVTGWTYAARGVPGFSSTHRTISDLTAQGMPHRRFLAVGLVVVGLCYLASAVALRPAALPGRVVLGVGGLGTVLVAAYPDPLPGDAAVAGHSRWAGVAVVALSLWPLLAARRHPPSGVLGLKVCGPVFVVLAAELLWFDHLLGRPDRYEGFYERLLVLSQGLWVLVVVVALRRTDAPA